MNDQQEFKKVLTIQVSRERFREMQIEHFFSKPRNTILDCPCGGSYTFLNESTHIRTALHCRYLENAKALGKMI